MKVARFRYGSISKCKHAELNAYTDADSHRGLVGSIFLLLSLSLLIGCTEKQKEIASPDPEPIKPELILSTGDQVDGSYRKVVLLSDEPSEPDGPVVDTLYYPMELDIAQDGRIFFIELGGSLKVWDPATKLTRTLMKLDVWDMTKAPNGASEEGLLGMALDPSFAQNGFIYLHYSAAETIPRNGKLSGFIHISRFEIAADGTLDRNSERTLLSYRMDRDDCCHAGGSMEFDSAGNLYIGTGDNTAPAAGAGYAPLDDRKGSVMGDSQRSAGNTNDLRGKILRIHPEPDGTYSVPEGNLFPQGTEKTRPEIYVMGSRNAYRLGLDRRKGILYWGDPGPDAGADDGFYQDVKSRIRDLVRGSRGPMGYDEINQARSAGNFGWPYFVGPNLPYATYDYDQKRAGELFDLLHPQNNSLNNTGQIELPTPQPSLIHYPYLPSEKFPEVGAGARVAAAGPVYYFDESLESECKLPREFDHVLFIYDWMRNWVIAVFLDDDEGIERMERFVPGMTFKRPNDLQIGPDGCLYIVEWGTHWGGVNLDSQIVRVEYRPEQNAD